MRFKISNMGPVSTAKIDMAPLTIICGENNSGKTYIVNAITEYYARIRRECNVKVKESVGTGEILSIDLRKYAKPFVEQLISWAVKYATTSKDLHGGDFQLEITDVDVDVEASAPDSTWTTIQGGGAKFSVHKNGSVLQISRLSRVKEGEQPNEETIKDQWHAAVNSIVNAYLKLQRYNGGMLGDVFSLTSERMGVAYFKDSLDVAVRARAKTQPEDVMSDSVTYADKVSDQKKLFPDVIVRMLDFISYMGQRTRLKILRQQDYGARFLSELQQLVGGTYAIDEGEMVFQPNGCSSIKIGAQEVSSSVRALFLLDSYLRYVAERGDMLVIDEPEMNLHPQKQRQLARLIARIVNSGLKVLLTTHSDYIIRELNILVQLNGPSPHLAKICEREGYAKDELLSARDVKVYVSKSVGGKFDFVPAEVSQEGGVIVEKIDSVIERMNDVLTDIAWGRE